MDEDRAQSPFAHDLRSCPDGRIHPFKDVQDLACGPAVVREQDPDLVGMHRWHTVMQRGSVRGRRHMAQIGIDMMPG